MMRLVVQVVAEPPFWDRLTVAAVGPLVTALVGTGVIGMFILKVSSTTQRRRAEADLRRELLAKVMNAAGTLYYATQSFWRAKRSPGVTAEMLAESRKEVDSRYFETRVQARLLEGELRALLGEDLATEWHKVDDLLTVRYLQLIGDATDRLYERNAKGYGGADHTGLAIGDLKNEEVLLDAYRAALKNVASEVMSRPFLRERQTELAAGS